MKKKKKANTLFKKIQTRENDKIINAQKTGIRKAGKNQRKKKLAGKYMK